MCLLGVLAAFAGTAAAQFPARRSSPPPLPVPLPALSAPAPIAGGQAQPVVATPAPAFPPVDVTIPPGKVPVDYSKYTKLPPRDKIFAIYDDPQLEGIIMNTIRDMNAKAGVKTDEATLVFPPMERVGGDQSYQAKTAAYQPMQVSYDALYMIHRRLHFEDKNTERYGWDLGIIQPMVSALVFYKDVLMWPQSLASGFSYGFWDTNAGKCLPGSPTPYMLYPPGLTVTGSLFEGVIITGASFIFP
jgi:hypothetical protein